MQSPTLYHQRATSKVLARHPLPTGDLSEQDLTELIGAAAWAPFHYNAPAHHRARLGDGAPEPWRFHVLGREICLALRSWLVAQSDMSKVPEMLAAARALVQVTWCPEPPPEHQPIPDACAFYPSAINMEHIAATAAALQNMLLCATQKGIPSYWSSGGPLRDASTFKVLGIPADEILLGSVFLFPNNIAEFADSDIRIIPGKMRDKRSTTRSWCRQLSALDTA